jgi:RHS repeat-associated protein
MDGIGSRALGFGDPRNRFKYNGMEEQRKEFSDGSGLEWYDYKNRFFDSQIGRFFAQDKLADQYEYYSPYQFAGNEVPNAIDLDGLEPLRMSENIGILGPSDKLKVPRINGKEWTMPAGHSTSRIRGGTILNSSGSETGYGYGPKATHPDKESVNIDGIVAGASGIGKLAAMKSELPPGIKQLDELKDIVQLDEEVKTQIEKINETIEEIRANYTPEVNIKKSADVKPSGEFEIGSKKPFVFLRGDDKHFYQNTVKKGTVQKFAQIDDSTTHVIPSKKPNDPDTSVIVVKKNKY